MAMRPEGPTRPDIPDRPAAKGQRPTGPTQRGTRLSMPDGPTQRNTGPTRRPDRKAIGMPDRRFSPPQRKFGSARPTAV